MCSDDVTGGVSTARDRRDEVLSDGTLGVLRSKTLDGRLALPAHLGHREGPPHLHGRTIARLEPDARVGSRDEDAPSWAGGDALSQRAMHGG